MRKAIEKKPVFNLAEAVQAAPYLRSLAQGKKRPTVQIIKIQGKDGQIKELFYKEDALGRPTVQIRDPDVTRRSPNVIAKDVAFKACMIALDDVVQSRAEGGKGSGLSYEAMAKVRSECMKKIYNNMKGDILRKVESLMGREDWHSIINKLAEELKGTAKSEIVPLIEEYKKKEALITEIS